MLLSDFPRNARNMVMFEPLWSIFGGVLIFYLPLYMRDVGLSDIQIGIVNTIGLFMSFIFFIIGAPLTNKYGRKRTTFIGDMVSWGMPMLIWAIARNFWYFVAAAAINSMVKIVFVSWNSLLIEDTPKEKRSRIYAILNIINTANGIFTLIAGLIISKFGTVSTMRVIFATGCVSMIIMFIIRNAIVDETKAGLQLMEQHKEYSLLDSLKSYSGNLLSIFKESANIKFAVIFCLMSFISSFNIFQVLYLNERLKISEASVSLAPGVNSVLSILIYIVVTKKLARHSDHRLLTISLTVCFIGSIVFIMIPQGSIPVFLIAMSMLTIGNSFTQAYLTATFMNVLREHEQADGYSGMLALMTLAGIPSAYLAGLLYATSPVLPFILNSILFAAITILSFAVGKNTPMRTFKGDPQNGNCQKCSQNT